MKLLLAALDYFDIICIKQFHEEWQSQTMVKHTPLPAQTGTRRHYVLNLSVRPSVRPFVCPSVQLQTREHDILSTNERISMQIGIKQSAG